MEKEESTGKESEMRHSWKDDVCVRCGCKRSMEYVGCKWTAYFYERSGIVYGWDRPDCIDWKVENNKTID